MENENGKHELTRGWKIAGVFVIIVFSLCFLIPAILDKKGNEEKNNLNDGNNNENSIIEKEEIDEYDGNEDENLDKTIYKTGNIYSKKKCFFKLLDGNDDGFSIEIKNKSKKDYSFNVHSMAINGIMTNCNIYTSRTDVPSKKKGTMDVEFESEWTDGIDEIEYIDMIVWAYDDAKNFKDFETDIIRIKTNKFSKENKWGGGKGVKSNGLIIKKDKLDTETLEFSVINKNKNYIEFDFGNSSVNEIALNDDYLFDAMGITVYPNCKANVNIDISELTDKNDIENVKNAEFSLKVRDKGSYFKEKTTKKIKFANK